MSTCAFCSSWVPAGTGDGNGVVPLLCCKVFFFFLFFITSKVGWSEPHDDTFDLSSFDDLCLAPTKRMTRAPARNKPTWHCFAYHEGCKRECAAVCTQNRSVIPHLTQAGATWSASEQCTAESCLEPHPARIRTKSNAAWRQLWQHTVSMLAEVPKCQR